MSHSTEAQCYSPKGVQSDVEMKERMPDGTKKRTDGTKSLPVFNRERCKQCGICAHFCPKGVMELDKDGFPHIIDADACNECKLCEYLCPDFGIEVAAPGKGVPGTGGGRSDPR